MKYDGEAVQCIELGDGIVELRLNLKGDSVNKLNAKTLKELREAVDQLKATPDLRGVLLASAKETFVVGADITEFLEHFKKADTEIAHWLLWVDRIFSDLEDLEAPSVAAINGFALGGGFELALACSHRVMSSEAKVGLPEVKLGIFPGWGGTVRLSRLTGADNAIEWIASGEQWNAEAALKIGAVDAVVPAGQVRDAALDLLKRAIAGEFDWRARRQEKLSPLKLNKIESMMVFEGSKGFVAAKAGPNYPAPVAAIEAMQKGATRGRDEALAIEAAAFGKVAKTPTAASLVAVFLGDQYLKKQGKKVAKAARPVKMSAVLGAGIMGGGVAYQSAARGVPIVMKDIQAKALDLGMGEASKLLEKQVSRGKMTVAQLGQTIGKIRPTLSLGDFKEVDLVVEAVVENENVKKAVLAETEAALKPGAILASNTSTISITRLAEGLKHPENFCGMHFFNPVHRMPLVEVIRGKKSSDEAIATTVAYAMAMGKTPVVVNDCAGFLVNRVLFPYFDGFIRLVADGVDFQRIDKVMERFGWPMGPAYLFDVVGVDTAHHATAVMAREYPDRMRHSEKTIVDLMFEAKRFGQKNGVGFYRYTPDKKGAPKKEVDPAAYDVIRPAVTGAVTVTDEQIVERMMLPMLIECARCLEETIVATPMDVDMGLIYGLGFPPFRGGALKYADSIGLPALCAMADKYGPLGKLYEPTARMRELAKRNAGFYTDLSRGEAK